jgi:quinol monooxygenase YgiN
MTIVISGEIDVPPERRDAALAGARALIEAAQAERGCRHYAWSANPFDPGRIHVFEEWESAADLQAHFEGNPYRDMLAHLSAQTILRAHTRKYRVDRVAPVYSPDGVPTPTFTDGKAAA